MTIGEAAEPKPSGFFRAEQISKSFGGVRAVRALSFNIAQGTIFAVIGPNGAGKSTLLNLMSGVCRPDSGALIFDGHDLTRVPPHRRVRHGVARTFQKIRLFKQLTVLENVVAGFHVHHRIPTWQYLTRGAAFRRDRAKCRDEAAGWLAFVGLTARASDLAGSLSYGEQRMLELARALATRPRLLLVDEPAAGLNGGEADALLERLHRLRRDGITIVLVEHNMDLVMPLADRILVMDYGQALFEGRPAEVQSNPTVIAAYLGGELS